MKNTQGVTVRILESKETASGDLRMVVVVPKDENIIAVQRGGMYKLGNIEDIVHANVLEAATPVTWCDVQQKWTDL